MTRKVFVVNNGGHDYSDAERFGEIVYCTGNIIRRDDTAQMFRELREALSDANPEDYILMSSLTSLCCVATAIMVEKFGELHMLIFHNGQYVSRDVILRDNV